jgi:hypothetical protein
MTQIEQIIFFEAMCHSERVLWSISGTIRSEESQRFLALLGMTSSFKNSVRKNRNRI